jgi:hypothetical protein
MDDVNCVTAYTDPMPRMWMDRAKTGFDRRLTGVFMSELWPNNKAIVFVESSSVFYEDPVC